MRTHTTASFEEIGFRPSRSLDSNRLPWSYWANAGGNLVLVVALRHRKVGVLAKRPYGEASESAGQLKKARNNAAALVHTPSLTPLQRRTAIDACCNDVFQALFVRRLPRSDIVCRRDSRIMLENKSVCSPDPRWQQR